MKRKEKCHRRYFLAVMEREDSYLADEKRKKIRKIIFVKAKHSATWCTTQYLLAREILRGEVSYFRGFMAENKFAAVRLLVFFFPSQNCCRSYLYYIMKKKK